MELERCGCETAETNEDFVLAAEEPFYAPSRAEKSPPCGTYRPVCPLRAVIYHHPTR